MFCDSIKRALQRKEEENGCEESRKDEDGENNTLSLMLDVQGYFIADHGKAQSLNTGQQGAVQQENTEMTANAEQPLGGFR